MPFFVRNLDGDEEDFIHRGTDRLETNFGPLPYEPGDDLVIPKGTNYRGTPGGPDLSSAHCTMIATDITICTFTPRSFESDPVATRVPTSHRNFDDVNAEATSVGGIAVERAESHRLMIGGRRFRDEAHCHRELRLKRSGTGAPSGHCTGGVDLCGLPILGIVGVDEAEVEA
jgi:hypothetical protein